MSKIFDNRGVSDTDESGKSSHAAVGYDTTGLFVSLYLIVLAFFVVMNSISNQDENKVNAATESVTRAFKNLYEPKADFVDVLANKDAITPNDEFYEQIRGVFASLIGFDGKFPTEGGNILKVSFKTSNLFKNDSSAFRSNQQKFLQKLADFLFEGTDKAKRGIKIIISSGKILPEGPRYWKNINILRAGVFVRQLKKRGVSGAKISIGISTGEEDRMVLIFSNHLQTDSSEQALLTQPEPPAIGGGL